VDGKNGSLSVEEGYNGWKNIEFLARAAIDLKIGFFQGWYWMEKDWIFITRL